MAAWLGRYKSGEYAGVWAEMEAAGADIRNSAYRKAAEGVVRETMERARSNVQQIFAELLGLGYRFRGGAEPAEPDYPLDVRIRHALEYVQAHGGKAYRNSPWSHPALAWVEEEEIELPAEFRKGKPARANYRPPNSVMRRRLNEVEQRAGGPLPLAIRGWFETVGAVDLAGTHPILNRDGSVEVLRVTLEDVPAAGASAVGAEFVEKIRTAFAWGGFPGWSVSARAPHRELKWICEKLLPL